ncbi:hypothetical protein BB559_006155 [Furculomyces boomerangus]|uniref:Reverse transcriptase RNase H-like domain-containing protein n=1 Tax=Furculomyces boomerangus TaxID=61424 RepID=A0A2T9Y496_9FUNG|nr:hypothetical protein BB559_006155 [Furculomyces boomerangus]
MYKSMGGQGKAPEVSGNSTKKELIDTKQLLEHATATQAIKKTLGNVRGNSRRGFGYRKFGTEAQGNNIQIQQDRSFQMPQQGQAHTRPKYESTGTTNNNNGNRPFGISRRGGKRLQQLGTGNNNKRFQNIFQENTAYKNNKGEEMPHEGRNHGIDKKEGHRRIPRWRTEFLLPSVYYTKEKRGTKTSAKPKASQQLHRGEIIQNGNFENYMQTNSTERLHGKHRSARRLYARVGQQMLQKVSAIPLENKDRPVQETKEKCQKNLHKGNELKSSKTESSGYQERSHETDRRRQLYTEETSSNHWETTGVISGPITGKDYDSKTDRTKEYDLVYNKKLGNFSNDIFPSSRKFELVENPIHTLEYASNKNYGITVGEKNISVKWNQEELRYPINLKELIAIYKALQLKEVLGKSVLILSNNNMAIAYVKKFGGTKSAKLLEVLEKIWKHCIMKGTRPQMDYIPSILNPADAPSRLIAQTEWRIAQ